MTGSNRLVLLSILLAAAAAPPACGGDTESSSAGTGGTTADAGPGGSSSGGAAQGGSAGAASGGTAGELVDASGGAAGGAYPSCTERGGDCTLLSTLAEPCPPDSYDPFSGALAHCPTDSIRRCCVPKGALGSPCTPAEPCDNGGCLPEASGYPTGGYCPAICEPTANNCPAWAVCLPVVFSQAMGMCLVRCSSNDMCREGWSCEAFPSQPFGGTGETTYVCWQGSTFGKELGALCASDDECLSMLCRPDLQQQSRCSASCDDARPCLAGYSCKPGANCSTPGCGTCAPS